METNKKRACICFIGLPKHFDYLKDSFKDNVEHQLLSLGFEIDYYMHTYNTQTFTNPRNHENNVQIDIEPLKTAFTYKESSIQELSEYDPEPRVNQALQYGDPWNNNGISLRYLFLQMNSSNIVTSLWKDKAADYSVVIYTRPDIYYRHRLQRDVIMDVHNTTINNRNDKLVYTPNFEKHWGANDRFFIATPPAAIILGSKLTYVDTFFEKHRRSIHSEQYLWNVIKDHDIIHKENTFYFQRVRGLRNLEWDGLPHPVQHLPENYISYQYNFDN
jgi:hypothetical protein